MAWTVPTYQNTDAVGEPSNVRTCMFELIRAIRERRTVKGGTHASFYKADGTLSNAAMTMDHLYKIPVSLVNENLVRIQDAIVDLLEIRSTSVADEWGFFEDDTFTDVWTLANLETAIGTSLQDSPLRTLEARFWQAQQDALDRLIYIKIVTPDLGNASGFEEKSGISFGVSLQDAWDNMLSDTPASSAESLTVGAVQGITSGTHSARTVDGGTYSLDTTGMVGTLVRASYPLRWTGTNFSYYTGDFACHVGSTAITFPGSASSPFDEVDADLADIDYGTSTSIAASFDSIPATVPFSIPIPSSGTTSSSVTLFVAGIIVALYIDISSSLTDEA